MSDISLIWTVSALVPETSAEQVGYCIRGPAVSLLEYAARDGLQHITAEAWSGVLAHVGQDRNTARRLHERAYLVLKAFQSEWRWTDVPGDLAQRKPNVDHPRLRRLS